MKLRSLPLIFALMAASACGGAEELSSTQGAALDLRPPMPSPFQVEATSFSSITSRWELGGGQAFFSGNGYYETHATSFRLEAGPSAAGPWTTVFTKKLARKHETGTAIAFTETGLPSRTTRWYRIVAVNKHGETAAAAAAATTFGDSEPTGAGGLSAPPTASARGISARTVHVTWAPSSSSEVTGYLVERMQGASAFVTVGVLPSRAARAFIDQLPQPWAQEPPTYRVSAYNGQELGYFLRATSAPVEVEPISTSPSAFQVTQVSPRWSLSRVVLPLAEVAIAEQSNGRRVVAGTFEGIVSLCGRVLNAGEAKAHAFVAQLDADGSCAWVTQLKSTIGIRVAKLAVDALGNIVFVGGFVGLANLGERPTLVSSCDHGFLAPILSGCSGNGDLLVGKLSPTGTVLWARGIGDDYEDYATDVVIDSSNAIVLAGRRAVPQSGMDGLWGSSQQVSLLRLSAAGNTSWNKVYTVGHGGAGVWGYWTPFWASYWGISAEPRLALGADDEIYFAGPIADRIELQSRTLLNEHNDLIAPSTFLARYTKSGAGGLVLRLDRPGSKGSFHVRSMAFDRSNSNIVLAGSYYGGAPDLGGGDLPGPEDATAEGFAIVAFGRDGTFRWQRAQPSPPSSGYCLTSVVVSAGGSIVAAGFKRRGASDG